MAVSHVVAHKPLTDRPLPTDGLQDGSQGRMSRQIVCLCRAGHLLVSYGIGLALRSARTVLEKAIVPAALTAVLYTSEVEHHL